MQLITTVFLFLHRFGRIDTLVTKVNGYQGEFFTHKQSDGVKELRSILEGFEAEQQRTLRRIEPTFEAENSKGSEC